MAFRLPTLPAGGLSGSTPAQQQIWWQQVVSAIEKQENAQDLLIADVLLALNTANAKMPDVPDVTLTASYTGAIDPAAQLPKSIQFSRYNGSTDVSAAATWGVASSGGVVGASVDSDGTVTFTDLTASGTITATSTHNSIPLSRTINVTKSRAPAPSGTSSGSGGGNVIFSQASGFASFTGSTFVPIATFENASLPTGTTQVDIAADLELFPDAAGSATIQLQAQHDIGSGWVDVGAVHTAVMSFGDSAPSTWTVNDPGLASATPFDWQILGRVSTGTLGVSVAGQVSGTAKP